MPKRSSKRKPQRKRRGISSDPPKVIVNPYYSKKVPLIVSVPSGTEGAILTLTVIADSIKEYFLNGSTQQFVFKLLSLDIWGPSGDHTIRAADVISLLALTDTGTGSRRPRIRFRLETFRRIQVNAATATGDVLALNHDAALTIDFVIHVYVTYRVLTGQGFTSGVKVGTRSPLINFDRMSLAADD